METNQLWAVVAFQHDQTDGNSTDSDDYLPPHVTYKIRFDSGRDLCIIYSANAAFDFPQLVSQSKKKKKKSVKADLSFFLKMGIDWKVQTAWLVINTPVAWVCHIKSFIAEYLHSMI